jgi:hypothetical protein
MPGQCLHSDFVLFEGGQMDWHNRFGVVRVFGLLQLSAVPMRSGARLTTSNLARFPPQQRHKWDNELRVFS